MSMTRAPTGLNRSNSYAGKKLINFDDIHHQVIYLFTAHFPIFFFLRWKNNIERKSKFQTLKRDSLYEGPDDKLRARYRLSSASALKIESFLYFTMMHVLLLSTNVFYSTLCHREKHYETLDDKLIMFDA
jgi:hypothetical protein